MKIRILQILLLRDIFLLNISTFCFDLWVKVLCVQKLYHKTQNRVIKYCVTKSDKWYYYQLGIFYYPVVPVTNFLDQLVLHSYCSKSAPWTLNVQTVTLSIFFIKFLSNFATLSQKFLFCVQLHEPNPKNSSFSLL